MRTLSAKFVMQPLLHMLAFLARRPMLRGACDALTRALARYAVKARHLEPTDDLIDLGRRWQRVFPSPRYVPLIGVSNDTLLAQIKSPCPLRGSGDLAACHCMMGFDREVLRQLGGEFKVLTSQATPGETVCTVAMRLSTGTGSWMAPIRPSDNAASQGGTHHPSEIDQASARQSLDMGDRAQWAPACR